MRGRVIRASGRQCLVEADGVEYSCQIRGRLRERQRVSTSPVAAGDWVELQTASQGGAVVESVLPRRSKISRMASGNRPFEQVLAANLDQFLVVVATQQPALSTGFIDRALVMALSGNVPPVICINKADLDPRTECGPIADVYRGLGYEVLLTSALTGAGMDVIGDRFCGRVSILVGPSGAGKSSILNWIEPGLALATSELMTHHDRGRHTTAATQLHRLAQGGFVADTPGVKQLQPWGVTPENLVDYFVEMAPLANSCQFRDCSHLHEPGCAIREAVEVGDIHSHRYDGYCRMAAASEDDSE
ncbi:ribosome small subunit-dependent GTPase A [Candidatus Latescibacterota bacterium]